MRTDTIFDAIAETWPARGPFANESATKFLARASGRHVLENHIG